MKLGSKEGARIAEERIMRQIERRGVGGRVGGLGTYSAGGGSVCGVVEAEGRDSAAVDGLRGQGQRDKDKG